MPGDATSPALSGGGSRSPQRIGQTKALGIIAYTPRAPTFPFWAWTPPTLELLGFPPAATKEVGRTEGGVRSQGGRQAGGEEREIRLLGGLLIWMAV